MRLLLLTLVSIGLMSCGNGESPRESNSSTTGRTLEYTGSVSFLDADGNTIATIDAAVANTPETRRTGLMDVHQMPEDKGMIFIFDREEPLSFWMANTPLPLDIIFVNRELEIVRIHRNARPYSTRSFESEQPAIYTIEVNAGYTSRYDIQEGMLIRYELN